MRINVIAVGKLRDQKISGLTNEYTRRLPAGSRISWIEVKAQPGSGEIKKNLALEAGRIRAKTPPRSHVAALSEQGRELNSLEFADWLGKIRDSGRDLCFIIGSANGLDPGILEDAADVIALSRLTFPHELVRAILAEQVYRAFSILRREPYHRG